MKKILVGIDGSKESRDAAKFAADLAVGSGRGIVLAGAVYAQAAFGAPELEMKIASWEAKESEHLKKVIAEVGGALEVPGLKIEMIVKTGAPAEILAELAADPDVEMVAVGHRGRGAIRRMLMGSVADRLVQICPKPVTVVR